MNPKKLFQRTIAVVLLLCLLSGMTPFGVAATEATTVTDASPLQEEKPDARTIPGTADLINQINDLKIPSVTQVSNWDTLDGLYFMGCGGRTFDHTGGICKTMGYLNLSASDPETLIEQKDGLSTVPFTVSGNRVLINSKETDLTHAVIISHTINSEYEMPDSLSSAINNQLDEALANTLAYGPQKGKIIYQLLNLSDNFKSINCDLNIYTYDIQFYNTNKFLSFSKWESVKLETNKRYPIMLQPSKTSNVVKMYKTNVYGELNGDNKIIDHSYWIGIDGYERPNVSLPNTKSYALTAATAAQIRRNNYGDRSGWPFKHQNFSTDWTIYKVATQTLELYKTLRSSTVKNFISAGNNGTYSEEAFNGYLLSVQKAINYYNDNYTNTSASDAVTKQCNDYCEMLTGSITMLKKEATDKTALNTLSADPSNYMDIPITVLDFRADGLMFENKNQSTPYTLSPYASDVEATLLNAIGVAHPGKNDGEGARIDLTLDTLVDGYPVYRKETVDYIAAAMSKNYQLLAASSFDPYWNNLFTDWANSGFADTDGDGDYGLGTWEKTLKKTSTPGVNGGILLYKDVDTAYDLAYYILNNIWRPVSAEDTILSSQTVNGNTFPVHYNMVVPELTTIRLTKDNSGDQPYYHFKSDLDVGRDLDSGIIFNTGNADDGTVPALNVMTDLGFEHPNRYGNDNTGAIIDRNGSSTTNYAPRVNYNYGIHARSVFVYYDAKDLQFTFIGDDDVYFFINGVLACDVGGMHGEVTKTTKVNDLAATLDLHDGDICTFDMFYVERHTSGINLNFSTNIEMMKAAAVTKEEQHAYTDPDIIGTPIREGSVVEDQTEIGYTYSLLNRSDYGVNHVSFTDPALGVSLSKDAITLNNKAQVEELIVTYRSYDPITSAYATVQPLEYDYSEVTELVFTESEFYKIIEAAVYNKATNIPMKDQACRITGLTVGQLMALLELGIPANTQIEIYGMHQTATLSAGTCTGSVQTACYPLDAYNVQGEALLGSDTRKVQVKELSSVTVESPLQIVIDYGKPVEIPVEDLTSSLTTTGSAVVSLVGFTHEGNHGTTMTAKPSNLKLTRDGDTYPTANGMYEHRGNVYRFTLNRLLEEVDRLNAVFSVSTSGSADQWYIMVAVEIMPATMVYYEAEDFTEKVFSFEEKTAQEVTTEFEAKEQTDREMLSAAALAEYMNRPDPTYRDDILYFGFNNTSEDQLRYQANPVYGGEQLDTAAEWWNDPNHWTGAPTIENGIMSFNAAPKYAYLYVGSGKDSSGNRNYPLRYTPAQEDWMEIRFRVTGATSSRADGTLGFKLELFNLTNGTADNHYNTNYSFDPSVFADGYYVLSDHIGRRTLTDTTTTSGTTYTMSYGDLPLITRVNLLFEGLTANQSVTVDVDYFYIGPEEYRPSAQGRHLMFDFSDSAAEQYRYASQTYGYTNYGVTDSWNHNTGRTASISVSDGVLKMTPNPDNTSYLYWARTEPVAENYNNLHYLPGTADYCQVRIKVENMEALSPDSPCFALYFSSDGNAIPNENQSFCYFDLPEKRLGQWFTLSFPITNPLWYASDAITAMHLQLGGMKEISGKEGALYIDYCYVGPSQPQDLNYAGEEARQYTYRDDVLYFDFDGDPEDVKRYSQSLYQDTVYDNAAKWYRNKDRNTVEVSDGSLQLKINAPYDAENDKDLKNCNPFAQTTKADYTTNNHDSARVVSLNYIPTATDCVQARIRFVNCKLRDEATSLSFRVYFMANKTPDTQHGILASDFFYQNLDPKVISTEEWFTVNLPANAAFRNARSIDALRIAFFNVVSASSEPGIIEFDYLYAGPAHLAPDAEVYGYDTTYTDDRGLSDGESLFVEGKGVKVNASSKVYSEVSFSFMGTGFDLISRTGKEQATLRVLVKDAAGNSEKIVTINNKGELELYQIPVFSIEDLPYGEHFVTIYVNKALSYTGDMAPLSRGGEFYLDAVRIYDPIHAENEVPSKDESSALSAYLQDGEAYPYIKEVRDVLLSAGDFNALTGTVDGAVYIDQANTEPTTSGAADSSGDGANTDETTESNTTESTTVSSEIVVENHISDKIATYEKIGPKNEVYLSKAQSIAFKLRLNTAQVPVSIDIGAKAINNSDTPLLTVGHTTSATAAVSSLSWTVATNSAQYYRTNITAQDFAEDEEGKYLYLVITNNGEKSVLSITDVKFGYDQAYTLLQEGQPPVKRAATDQSPVSFLVDGGLAPAAEHILETELPKDEGVIVDPELPLYHSLNLASDIAINYVVPKEALEGCTDIQVNVTIPQYEGNTLVGTSSRTLLPVEKGEYYYFVLDGLTAVNMTDEITAVLTMEKDGRIYVSEEDRYSIASYAYGQMEKATVPQAFRALCVNLLRYGSLAQSFKGYRTDSLADGKLTEEQKVYLTDLDTVELQNNSSVGTELPQPTIQWKGQSLDLASKVTLTFIFSATEYSGSPEDLTLKVRYVDEKGQEVTTEVVGAQAYNADMGLYQFRFSGLLASGLRSVLTVQVYEGDTPLSCTKTYSADTYGIGKAEALQTLCKALFAYSDSARAYFHS